VTAGRSPLESEEILTAEQRELERVYLALRTAAGLPRENLPSIRLTEWERGGWLIASGTRVRCTPEGWLRLDALVGALTERPVVT